MWVDKKVVRPSTMNLQKDTWGDIAVFLLILQLPFLQILLPFEKGNFILVIGLIFWAYFKKVDLSIPNRLVILFLFYIALCVAQGLYFGHFSTMTLIYSFSYIFFAPYLLYRIYGLRAIFLFEKVIFIMTFISLVIWIGHQMSPAIKLLILKGIEIVNNRNDTDIHRFMIIYTYWPMLDTSYGISRNAGFSGEPATFCAFLILGLAIHESKNGSQISKRSLIYILALITSLSTTGYSAFIVYFLTYLIKTKDLLLRLIIFPLIAMVFLYVFSSLDFMENKITQQYQEGTGVELNSETSGRVLGIRKSIYVLFKYPFLGRGLQANTRPQDPKDAEYADYGFLSILSKYGLFFGGFFFILFLSGLIYFFRSVNVTPINYWIYIVAILVTLLAQQGMYDIYFMIFFIMGWLRFNHH